MKVFVAFSILVFGFNLAYAHSCVTFSRLSDEEHLKELSKTDIIFQGEILSISDDIITDTNRFYRNFRKVNLKVIKAWKGIETTQTTALFAENNPCGVKLEVGKKYMIYSGGSSDLFEIDCCSFGRFDEKRIPKQLGEGKIIEEPEPTPIPTETSESFWSTIWSKITSFFS
jgi:hypothetical protein